MAMQSVSEELSAGEDRATATAPSAPAPAPGPAAVLAQCDRLIGEIGRRHHMFSWLRNPEGGADRWLEVDAYYPSQRLVVLCRRPSAPFAEVYRDLVPAHGLRLLELDPAELHGDLHAAIGDRLSALQPANTTEHRSAAPVPAGHHAAAPAPTGRTAATVPAGRHAAAARASSRSPKAPAERVPAPALPGTQAVGMLIGLALVVVLGLEFYLGIAKALSHEHWLLAFGLALDLGARTMGTIIGARTGEAGWAWACVLIGSPAVAAGSLPKNAPLAGDPAPLAGVLAMLAMGCVAVGLIVG